MHWSLSLTTQTHCMFMRNRLPGACVITRHSYYWYACSFSLHMWVKLVPFKLWLNCIIHMYIHPPIHQYIHTYICLYISVCTYRYVHTYIATSCTLLNYYVCMYIHKHATVSVKTIFNGTVHFAFWEIATILKYWSHCIFLVLHCSHTRLTVQLE